MKYNIIGDIHGRTSWKKLVKDNCINIFVGDYFSPYEYISFDEQRQNFLDIINYKIAYPETILLIGNHDEDHWHIKEKYSRFDVINLKQINELFDEFKDLFQIAYATKDNQVLISHAGVSIVWYIKYKYGELIEFRDISKEYADVISIDDAIKDIEMHYPLDDQIFYWNKKYYLYKDNLIMSINVNPKEIMDFINDLWKSENYKAFNFRSNCDYYDCYGASLQHGPIWIRPLALLKVNIFRGTNFIQVVGHSQVEYPHAFNSDVKELINVNNMEIKDNNIILTDCLGYTEESVIYENKNFNVNIA
jgi:hypothetical protein